MGCIRVWIGVLCLCGVLTPLHAQWQLMVRQVRLSDLPVVHMNVLMLEEGRPYVLAGRSTWEVHVDNVPVPVEVTCPDTTWRNSVAMVLDNSGSMLGGPFDMLQYAAKTLVNAFGMYDEGAIIANKNGPLRVCDFTADKDTLRASISSMRAWGNTYMTVTVLQALRELVQRGGKRSLVVFSDGVDVMLDDSVSVIRALALGGEVRLFTIGYGSNTNGDRTLQTLASSTGGRHWHVENASQFYNAFRAIAAELIPPGCRLSFPLPQCTVSIHPVLVQAWLDSAVVSWDSTLIIPSRPDTVYLSLDAPAAVRAGDVAEVAVTLSPALPATLPLSFRLVIRYDEHLLDLADDHVHTSGTLLDGSTLSMRAAGPGRVVCEALRLHPRGGAGVLFTVPFRGLFADSSRPVPLSFEEATLSSACENVVMTRADTMDVCQCIDALPLRLRADVYARADTPLHVDMLLPAPLLREGGRFRAQLQYDRTVMQYIDVAAAHDSASIRTSASADRIHMDIFFPRSSSDDSLLCRLRFRVRQSAQSAHTSLALPVARAWADCCYGLENPLRGEVSVDGYCGALLGHRNGISMGTPLPHPVHGRAMLPVSVSKPSSRAVRIILCDAHGGIVSIVHDAPLAPGTHLVPIDVSTFPAGMYVCILDDGGTTVTRRISVVP